MVFTSKLNYGFSCFISFHARRILSLKFNFSRRSKPWSHLWNIWPLRRKLSTIFTAVQIGHLFTISRNWDINLFLRIKLLKSLNFFILKWLSEFVFITKNVSWNVFAFSRCRQFPGMKLLLVKAKTVIMNVVKKLLRLR